MSHDVSQGSLTAEQVAEYTDALSRHYGERVAPVSDYCRGFYDWEQAILDKVQRLKAGTEKDYEAERWERIAEALNIVGMAVGKSSMLNRRIYGGEKLRTEMCPEHHGHWMGLDFHGECACHLTGWLPS